MRHFMWKWLLICILGGCTGAEREEVPVAVTWMMGTNGVEKNCYDNYFVIRNISGKPLGKEWEIYYSQLPTRIRQPEDAPVKIEAVNGNFYRMIPAATYESLKPGDSLRLHFVCSNSLIKNSQAPEGMYFIGKDKTPQKVAFRAVPLERDGQWSRPGMAEPPYPGGEFIYRQNEGYQNIPSLLPTDILPAVKQRCRLEGMSTVGEKFCLRYEPTFEKEARILKEKLNAEGWEVAEKEGNLISMHFLPSGVKPVNEEYYELTIRGDSLNITAGTAHGMFNGVQTLLSILRNCILPCEIRDVHITDYPDLLYRGCMLDVARNFTGKEGVMKLIDLISSYKLNTLHFHITDDEAWRLDIPGLEELTQVGSRRGHTRDEKECLYPGYDGCFDPTDLHSTSNGYYSREDFIEILKYAHSRHINVIPEIESPGHARAAIQAMKVRYHKYENTDREKALEYLLCDFADTSVYYSAQAYSDNVMNAALPSVYRFMEKVTDELVNMYQEAGAPLTTIHIGGDEVPEGVWKDSPECHRLMEREQMTEVRELSSYFLEKMAALFQKKKLSFSGWQEVAIGHDEATDARLRPQVAGIYCWDTAPEWGADEVPYQIANNGYPVILCNVKNLYLDMAYNNHPDEPGLYWGGFVDEQVTFNILPFDNYRSVRTDRKGRPVDLRKAGTGKVQLTETGKQCIKGIQAQLFSETIRNFSMVEYYIFPKIFGLVERGWNTYPVWAGLKDPLKEKAAWEKDALLYHAKIVRQAMPRLHREKVNFRIGQPGLQMENGILYANSPIPGAEIRYTTDGTEPTATSLLWTGPVACKSGETVKAKLFYEGKQSVTTQLR